MARVAARSRLTPAEYLAWEREQVDKHEYHAGDVFAMAGGSPRHNWIAGNVQSALKRALDDTCFTFTSDQRIVFDEGRRYVYPDVSAVCGPIVLQDGTRDVIANPSILIEVLSSTTERWPHRDGRSLLDVVREALVVMTAGHCSYCDGHPLGATGLETVDHFRPKSHPAFHELVCTWTNLFLVCTACNHAKREQWDEALLRPDDLDFCFERYFEYRFDSGKLQPASTASPEEQWRARRTIEILDLNRADACASRMRVVRHLRIIEVIDDLDEWAYRYLIPLCRAV